MPRGSQASQEQKKGKGKRARNSDDDEPDFSQQASQSQSTVKLTGEDERKGVNRIVKLLLCKDGQKKAVSRGDIFVAIKAEGVPAGAANVNALIEGARKKLKHVFGFELVEGSKSELYCDTTYSQQSQAKRGSEKIYMLRNALHIPPADQEQDAAPIDPEDEAVKTRVRQIELLSTPQPTDFSFTLNVLALITLSNFKMKESELLECLGKLGVSLRRGQTLEDMISALKTQMYIDDVQERDEDDQKQTYYLPGLRAEKEVTRKRIVDYIENIFGEQMSKQERNRLLPTDEEETDEGIAAD